MESGTDRSLADGVENADTTGQNRPECVTDIDRDAYINVDATGQNDRPECVADIDPDDREEVITDEIENDPTRQRWGRRRWR